MNRTLVALCLFVAACASSAPPTRPNDREWNKLSAEYASVQQVRSASPRPSEKASRKEQIEVALETQRKVDGVLVPFLDRLQEYYDRTGDPRAAAVYAAERIRIGDDYMNILARYDRAVNMYQSALSVDPENAEARNKLALAESRRFASMDSFAQVKEGMREEQVKSILGVPREDWIKQVVQRNRVYSVWIYPKKDGGASAVYFDAGVVYHTNWNAAPSKNESREGGANE